MSNQSTEYQSIVRELVIKDLRIMKIPSLCYWLGGIGAIALAMGWGDTAGTIAFILFISTMFGAGVHAAMQTITEERREQNLPFIMSLPVTIGDYTRAKMLANLLLVGGIWLTLSAASYVIFIGDVMPNGTIPFMTIILVAVFLAYIMILATTMIFEGLAPAITAIVAANLGSQALVWWISSLHGVRSTVNGLEVVWNSTYLTVLGCQIGAIVGLIALVFYAQSKKTEFL
jgi:hypothetical protein